MRVVVYGLWHLGCVTAACLAKAGHQVVGLELDSARAARLRQGQPPVYEPGLDELLASGLASGQLSFTTRADASLADAELLWVSFDTPVNDQDEADLGYVLEQLEAIRPAIRPATLVLISSQVPVGFTRSLEQKWQELNLHFAYSPENLRLGNAVESFLRPERIVIGVRQPTDKARLTELWKPFCSNILWMSVESAEMTKHALNAFLATSVTFINEVARICEAVGADAKEVELGLKSEPRIGPRAYLSPGGAFAGGTLARDVQFLMELGRQHGLETPLFQGVFAGNELHKGWVLQHVHRVVRGTAEPVVAILGLTYKAGTSTLRRSAALELCQHLWAAHIRVQAHDPMVEALPPSLAADLNLCATVPAVLTGADVLVVNTGHPEYRELHPELLLQRMRRPCVIDPNHFLASQLQAHPNIVYIATGKPA